MRRVWNIQQEALAQELLKDVMDSWIDSANTHPKGLQDVKDRRPNEQTLSPLIDRVWDLILILPFRHTPMRSRLGAESLRQAWCEISPGDSHHSKDGVFVGFLIHQLTVGGATALSSMTDSSVAQEGHSSSFPIASVLPEKGQTQQNTSD